MTVGEMAAGNGSAGSAAGRGLDLGRARARARARVTAPAGSGKALAPVRDALAVVGRDFAEAWAWRETPPALAKVWASRIPAKDAVPGDGAAQWLLWAAWVAFNHLWALPVTAIGYGLLWTQQHPARAFPTDVTVVAVTAMLINSW